LRSWVERLDGMSQQANQCNFRHKEILGAGHFWHDHDAIKSLQEEVKSFIGSL